MSPTLARDIARSKLQTRSDIGRGSGGALTPSQPYRLPPHAACGSVYTFSSGSARRRHVARSTTCQGGCSTTLSCGPDHT
eukprot:4997217-Prymnesium_polylepis.1